MTRRCKPWNRLRRGEERKAPMVPPQLNILRPGEIVFEFHRVKIQRGMLEERPEKLRDLRRKVTNKTNKTIIG
jgi:hypothetical protein